LERSGDTVKVKRAYLYSLNELEYSTARVKSYAKTIREKSLLRRLIQTAREIEEDSHGENVTIDEVLGRAEEKILSLSLKTRSQGFDKLITVVEETMQQLIYLVNHPNELGGVPTGYLDLDRVLNGLHKSDLILLAARPSMGKTALALNMAVNAARKKNSVAIFSLEMSKGQLGKRILSTASGVNSLAINTGRLSDGDMGSLLQSAEDLSKLNLFIDDTAGIGMLELRSKVRRLKHDQGLDLIVIDYLQLMQGQRSRLTEMNRQQEISEISRSLKSLAREMEVPVLALSQLSRSVELRAEKKPQLSDLRESGSLEQDADIVMFLYRDEYYNRDESENKNVAELIIAKNRNGPTTSVRLRFDKDIMKFDNLLKE
ncbi:MAG: replicative DNA helicase, partial [Selenomonadaceae bacterium]|nr:replicative DNA helicase [Selenomonadaceae bacterium]